MVPLSIAIATSARVSYWLGAGERQPRPAGDPHRLQAGPGAGAGAVGASWRWAAGSIAGIYSAQSRRWLPWRPGCWPGSRSTTSGDATQALCVFVLRCYRVAVAPLVAYCVLLWGVGLAGGYALAYHRAGPLDGAALARPRSGLPARWRWRLLSRHPAADSVAGCALVSAGGSSAARSRLAGNTDREGRAHAGRAVDLQLGAVALRHVLDDRQAQPGAAGFARAAAVHAVEALGQPRNVLGRDARARCRAPKTRRGHRAATRHCTSIDAVRPACSAPHCSPGWTSR